MFQPYAALWSDYWPVLADAGSLSGMGQVI